MKINKKCPNCGGIFTYNTNVKASAVECPNCHYQIDDYETINIQF